MNLDEIRVDRTVLTVANLHDEPDDKAFWLSKTPEERLQMTELLRQINYGYDPATARLQRVLTIAKRERR